MAFCIHCGSEVASDATFCHSCGNALQAASAEVAPPPVPEPVASDAPIESGASWTSESQVDSGASGWASAASDPGAPSQEASWGTPTPSSSWASSTPEVPETPQTVDSGASSSWGTGESSWSAPQATWGAPETTAPLAEPEPAPPGSWPPTAPATPPAEPSSWSAPTTTPPPTETGWPPSLSSTAGGSAPAVVPPTPAAGVPNYLVASIVTTVLSMACCGCLPIGAISLIFAAQANSKAALGLADDAMRNAGLAKTWLIVAWVLMGLSLMLWIGYIGLIVVAGNL